jgi:DNA-binding MarR family transcriptional regulator
MAKSSDPIKHPLLEALRHSAGICNCLALRQAARTVTQMYDQCLAPAGLSIGQYSVLAALYYAEAAPMKKLATRLEMDRTSLTRALAPLERDGLVVIRLKDADRRSRLISLTSAGLERLISAYPLWERAQELIGAGVSGTKLEDLRGLLREASDVAARRM